MQESQSDRTDTLNHDLLDERIREICEVMKVHAGAIELIGADASGNVQLAFTGMCAGCQLRAVTMQSLIEPALLDLPGVRSVEAAGSRLSVEAAARQQAALERSGWQSPVPSRWRAPIGKC